MGFLDSIVTGAHNMVKANYKNMTGRDYDRDFRRFLDEFKYKSESSLRDRWDELSNNSSVRFSAEKQALIEIMKERGIDRY